MKSANITAKSLKNMLRCHTSLNWLRRLPSQYSGKVSWIAMLFPVAWLSVNSRNPNGTPLIGLLLLARRQHCIVAALLTNASLRIPPPLGIFGREKAINPFIHRANVRRYNIIDKAWSFLLPNSFSTKGCNLGTQWAAWLPLLLTCEEEQ